MSAISIVMPCHNRAYDLTRVLRAYDMQNTDVPFQLIAVDDASTDETYDALRSYLPERFELLVERLERNQGPAAARNRGIALAQAALVLFVGDDILPGPDLVRGHLEAHRQRPAPEAAILGRVEWAHHMPQNTLMTHIDGVGAEQFSYFYLKDAQGYDFRHFYTANISLKRDLLCSLDHWFDTDFRYPAFEDAELSFRLARRGMRITYLSALCVEHGHYHTIWSFSTRQYHSGLMAWVLVRKHPAAAPQILGARFGRILSFAGQRRAALEEGVQTWLETQAQHLVSFYEWTPHPLLDGLYRRVLEYFYFKGVIEAVFGKTRIAGQVHGAHVRQALVPAIGWFVREAIRTGVPLPEGYGTGFATRFSRFWPSAASR